MPAMRPPYNRTSAELLRRLHASPWWRRWAQRLYRYAEPNGHIYAVINRILDPR
jgi:hypothetical protein